MSPDYFVRATRKGGLPLSVEKRRYGKPVTILENCGGDVPGLLAAIKAALGTGGTLHGGGLEIQGSLIEQLSAWLLRAGIVRGLAKPARPHESEEDAAAVDAAVAAARPPRDRPRWSAERVAAATRTATTGSSSLAEASGARSPYDAFCALWRGWPYWDQVQPESLHSQAVATAAASALAALRPDSCRLPRRRPVPAPAPSAWLLDHAFAPLQDWSRLPEVWSRAREEGGPALSLEASSLGQAGGVRVSLLLRRAGGGEEGCGLGRCGETCGAADGRGAVGGAALPWDARRAVRLEARCSRDVAEM